MRIVAVADTHLFTDTLSSIPEGDLFIHAGDLLHKGDLTELERGLDWLKTLSFQYKILVAGNHDGCFEKKRQRDYARQITREAGVIYPEDSSTTIEGIKLWGSPWQPTYNNWAFTLHRCELEYDQETLSIIPIQIPPKERI